MENEIADVCKKVSRCIGILNKVKSILSTRILNSLYSSLVNLTSHIVLRCGEIHIEHICNPYIKNKKGQSVLYVKVATCVIQKSCFRN